MTKKAPAPDPMRTRKKHGPKGVQKGNLGQNGPVIKDTAKTTAPLKSALADFDPNGGQGDLVTPNGILVYAGEPHTPEWFAARRDGITGTDVPKILGHTKYGNALSVWLDKNDQLDDDGASEAAEFGTLFEDPIARKWAKDHDVEVSEIGIIADRDEPWKRASLDRVVHTCPDGDGENVCGLEVKTRSAYLSDQYEDDLPRSVVDQVAWGRKVSGFDHMHVTVVVGGQSMRNFRYDENPALEKALDTAAAKAWETVIDGTPPDVAANGDGSLIKTMNTLYKNRKGVTTIEGDKLDETKQLLVEYAEMSAKESAFKKEKEKRKERLVQIIDSGDTAMDPEGNQLFTYRPPGPSKQLAAADRDRLQAEKPETFNELVDEGYITTKSDSPRFNMPRSKKPKTEE